VICRKCGRESIESQTFCRFCGTTLAFPRPGFQAQSAPPAQPKPTISPEPNKSMKWPSSIPTWLVDVSPRPHVSTNIPCKVCNRGVLVPKRIYRLSAPVVAIGYIFLIPSVLGMIAGGLIFFGVIAQGGDESSGVIGGGFAILLGVASFVGGLLGWLLIMKKRVLQCSVCSATVSAS
jgi:hypothetical protein